MRIAGVVAAVWFCGWSAVGFAAPEHPDEPPVTFTMRGEQVTLEGPPLKRGQRAPAFTVTNDTLQPVSLGDFRDKIKVISTVPSIDTQVCSRQTRRFNELASQMGLDVVVLTISMDLPFAQKRWCATEGIDRAALLSDFKDRSFGAQYGILIKEKGLLARAVFVIDKDNVVRYIQRVPEMGQEPDYDEVLKAIETVRAQQDR